MNFTFIINIKKKLKRFRWLGINEYFGIVLVVVFICDILAYALASIEGKSPLYKFLYMCVPSSLFLGLYFFSRVDVHTINKKEN